MNPVLADHPLLRLPPPDSRKAIAKEVLKQKVKTVFQRAKVIGKYVTCQKDPIAKPIMIKEEYWLEAVDQTHRYGGYLYAMLHLWKHWNAQAPFFEWFEKEGKELVKCRDGKAISILHRYWENSIYISLQEFEKWLDNLINPITVVYLDRIASEPFLISFDEKGTLIQSKAPLDTKGQRFIFVLDTSFHLYGCNYFPGKWHHSSLTRGAAVLAGGGLDIEAGKVVCIDDKIGHYDDGNQIDQAERSIRYFLNFLLKNKADLSQTELKINVRPHSKFQIFHLRALDFLKDSYLDQPWYVGARSREAAVEKLTKGFSFIVRQSENPVPLSQRKTVNGHATVTVRAPCFELVHFQSNQLEFIPIYKDGLDPFILSNLYSPFLTEVVQQWAESNIVFPCPQQEIDSLSIDEESKKQLGMLLDFMLLQKKVFQFKIGRLPYGHSHQNFHIEVNGEKYFIKLAHPSKASFLEAEYSVLQELHRNKVNFHIPIPLELIRSGHAILMFQNISGANWEFSEQGLIEQVIPEIKKVHSFGMPHPKELDHFDLVLAALQRMEGIIDNSCIQMKDVVEIQKRMTPYLEKQRKVFCHNDLHSGNLFPSSDGKLHILDWETAAYNHYLFDLAVMASHHQLSLEQMKKMLICYDPLLEGDFEMFLLSRVVVDLYYHLWCIERMSICDRKESLTNFAKIYLESYKRHLTYAKTLEMI